MNIIFLTMVPMASLEQRGIYQDLLRCFVADGHKLFVVFPQERRLGKETRTSDNDGVHFLGVKTLNLRKSSVIEKGVGQVLVQTQFKRAIKKFWANEKYDLILYSTPPITLIGIVQYLKKRNPEAKSYLLLKDIFPQNAVDLGLMSKTGMKGVLYKYFRKKEKSLYALSDFIGCMSPSNVEYVLKHNTEVYPSKVEVAPNSIELNNAANYIDDVDRREIRRKYGLPVDKPIFIYCGNLGKPQGIPFLLECLDANAYRDDCFFLVIGTGTELSRLKQWYDGKCPKNVKVMNGVPKSEYDILVRSCDVGLIFLDHRFTIPNYPSRMLSYLEYKMPVLCATDVNSDMGRIAEKNRYGYWCESVRTEDFTALVDKMLASDIRAMGEMGYEFLKQNYLVEHTYNIIMRHFNPKN